MAPHLCVQISSPPRAMPLSSFTLLIGNDFMMFIHYYASLWRVIIT